MTLPGVGGPETCTGVCGIHSLYLLDHPRKAMERAYYPHPLLYHCPRCGSSCSSPANLRKHFPACVKTNGNPESLKWFDGSSNDDTSTNEQQSLEATVNSSMGKPSGFGLASSFEDEPGARKAMSKVDRWAAMARKQAANDISTSNNGNGAASPSTYESTVPESTMDNYSDTAVTKKPALKLTIKPKPAVRFVTPPSREEPVTPSKAEDWTAAAGNQTETVISTSNNLNGAESPAPYNSTAPRSIMKKYSDSPIAIKPALKLTIKPKQTVRFVIPPSREEPVTPARVQQPLRLQEPIKFRSPSHTENTAHLFNSAGFLIPSIPGIDSVTERLFDKGEIMSLRPPRSNDGYYPDGEPCGGSFLMEYSNQKKRKRDDEN